jgi:hypothetical protein
VRVGVACLRNAMIEVGGGCEGDVKGDEDYKKNQEI